MIRSTVLGIICAALAAHGTWQTPVAAEPFQLSDFEWQKRMLVSCDLTQPIMAPPELGKPPPMSGWLAWVIKILAEDVTETSGQRELALVHITPNSWQFMLQAQSEPPGESARQDRLCPDCGYTLSDNERALIKDRLECEDGDRVLALIGLDGEIKQTWRNEIPSAEDVFALIDAMPMRQRELQRLRRD